ncbi:MAG: LDCC motif putative metal-binding protein [Clostridium sp.]|nr:LDCC motif putative metal-binding protein [Clostridium sp.]
MYEIHEKIYKKFLNDIEKANEKEFGKSGQLDCCKLNKSHKKK